MHNKLNEHNMSKITLALLLVISLTVTLWGSPSVTAENDTLTYIQYPLINVPAISRPGDSLEVLFSLPDGDLVQTLSLEYGAYNYELSFSEKNNDPFSGLRRLVATIPDSLFFTLYDLKLICTNADNNMDISEQSVYIIPEYKDSYTFVHVTDTHLPSHYFWGDTGLESDSTELLDFRSVIDDINIINPEFVLHTGDLINDGEIEALGVPSLSRTKKLLHELKVPMFVVAGNHDLGGWDYTPAPDGTARKTWWKYMGWKHLDDASGTGPITQDYAFNYGNDLYVGLEAYQLYGNYDGWRENIYGSTSFTNGQIQWLNQVLNDRDKHGLKVLFYHKDFDYDLDLSSLGADAAFWGHIHSSTGDLNSYPYNISTGSTCDGRRRYRIVKVVNNQITFTQSVDAGSSGENLSMISNQNGTQIRIINGHYFPLENCLVRFKLADGLKITSLNNATLYQVDSLSSPKIVYALVNVPANTYVNASIETDSILSSVRPPLPNDIFLMSSYPNPFNPLLKINYQLSVAGRIKISIYNLLGECVDILEQADKDPGQYILEWNAERFAAGLYFVKAKIRTASGAIQFVNKCLLMK